MASGSGAPDIWTFPDIVDYFRADSEIADTLSVAEFNDLLDVKTDWVKLVRTALEYQGFDPRVILSQLLRNRKSYEAQKPDKVTWDLRNVGDDLKVNSESADEDLFSNMETLARDINFMITVFLARNNHINKIIKKARGGVEDILNMLKEKYVIDDDTHKSGTSLESRTITLPRIAGVFPGSAVRMFHNNAVKEIVTYDSFPGTMKPTTHGICCPLLPSVCPMDLNAAKGSNFHPVMIWTAIKLDEIIHRRDKEYTPLIELLGYYRAGYQSNAVPAKSRKAMFVNIGLLIKNGTDLTTEAKALVSSCQNSLGSLRTEDENHDLMVRVAKSGDMSLF